MIPLRASEIAQALNGQLIGADVTVTSVQTDSRILAKNDCFLALKGPNFDGHKFVQQVVSQGASAVIVESEQSTAVTQIIVKDSHKALGQLGAYVKAKVAPKTVAITGSSGKTTVKEMVAAILSRLGNVLATKGNFNNDIGVPLTLLRLESTHEFAVVELGANHLGEIAYTSSLVKPDVAIINNIAAAHLEGFGDLCGVARAKGEIFEGLVTDGVAIYNEDSKYASKWQWRLTDKNVKRFSCADSNEKADAYSTDVTLNDNGCASFTLNTAIGNSMIELGIPGKHNVCNAVAAATIALEFGATLDDIRHGLLAMNTVQGRLNLHQISENIRLIDDTYNANVESVKAASALLASYDGKRILVLGDMGELGSEARQYHHEVGQFAAQQSIDHLLTLGVLSQNAADAFGDKGQHFDQRAPLVARLQQLIQEQLINNEDANIIILVKGSRSAHMEKVVKDIIEWQESIKENG